MSIAENIKFIKGVSAADVAKLGKTSKENYNSLKDDTNNFKDTSIIEAVPEVAKTLDLWVQNAKKKGIKPGASSAKAKPVKASKAKKEKPAKASKPKKAIKETKPKGESQVVKLKAEAEKLRKEVVANAKFKNKLGDELTAFLKKNPITLGATPSQVELETLKNKIKFYKNLLKGDIADFKAIAQRVGIEPRKLKLPKKSNFSKAFPNAKAKPMYNDGTPLSGLGSKPKYTIQQVNEIAKKIQHNSGVKEVKTVKYYRISRKEATQKAFKQLKSVSPKVILKKLK